MKDRTPKFPGRVKMTPVAGQTDTYDMTRADDPDDTGTPFNTRTMLQDSTGQFLKLPLANPFPDDAFRHMVDRIVPIGTIRTSPAQSLGDAWLKCDGSQVTFLEYPQLCQLLRGASSTQWADKQFAVGATVASNAVRFKGKWYVASFIDDKLTIYAANTIDGDYSVVAENLSGSQYCGARIVCNDSICVIVSAISSKLCIGYTEDGTNWTSYAQTVDLMGKYMPIVDVCAIGDVFLIGFEKRFFRTGTVKVSGSWKIYYPTPAGDSDSNEYVAGLSAIDGKFVYVRRRRLLRSGERYYRAWMNVYVSTPANEEWAETAEYVFDFTPADFSNVVKYNGKYWILYKYKDIKTTGYPIREGFLYGDSLTEFAIGDSKKAGGAEPDNDLTLTANETFMIIRAGDELKFSADPLQTESGVELPEGATISTVSIEENVAIATGGGTIYHHDYSTDTRLLPLISLSDDTTTFIKAKNELDVFEANTSGG